MLSEKQKEYYISTDGYANCLQLCNTLIQDYSIRSTDIPNESTGDQDIKLSESNTWKQSDIDKTKKPSEFSLDFLNDMKGEILLRMAMLKKDLGALDQAKTLCNTIIESQFGESIRSNALTLLGIIFEIHSDFPAAEAAYADALKLISGHLLALERLGRIYLRYRETVPAAVQFFFKAVETNPSNHVAWYLLGRCYMTESQYNDAFEAYNRSINLNPNDSQVWCSLGIQYYAFGQYREALGMLARALKLDPTNSDAWYNVGALYDMADQPDDAQCAYQRAKEYGLDERFHGIGSLSDPLTLSAGTSIATKSDNIVNIPGKETSLDNGINPSIESMINSKDDEDDCN